MGLGGFLVGPWRAAKGQFDVGTMWVPLVLAHMGLGGFLVGPWRAAKGQFDVGTMWVPLVLAHMGLGGFLVGPWRAAKGQFDVGTMWVPLVLSPYGLTQVVPTWFPRQIAPLQPARDPQETQNCAFAARQGPTRNPPKPIWA